MESSSQHRQPRKRHSVLVFAAVMVVVAFVGFLVMVFRTDFRPDRETDDGRGRVTSVAGSEVTESPSATPTRKPSSASPTATARATTSTATASSASPRPSATSAPRAVSGAAPLAGRIKPDVTYDGVATFYDAADGNGACLFGPTDNVMTAAMNTTDYETSKACGAYVRVRAASGATITVRITNLCPGECAPGQLDLSAQAFAKLADPVAGRIPITWTLLSPDTSDTLSIRYKTGSSAYWCGIQVIGHRNPVARLEVRTGSGWSQLPRTEYNYFLSEQGSGCGGAIRITDIYGEQLTVDGIAVRPDVVQSTRVQFAQH
ncbi:expansin EXLX1 family cellulose-binding protein [Streptomyces fulvoviolaceus]|uniref:expansin EXLX1 family cellulose-binding protein n=1 Tax=Streptomyces fulvoviolaceus TaxID=285535 RepID=UPI0004C94B7F